MSIPDPMRELRYALQRLDDAPADDDGALLREVIRQAHLLVADYDSWREYAEWARNSQLKLSPTPEALRAVDPERAALPTYIYADSHGHYYDARNGEGILIRDEADLRRVEAAFEAQGGNGGIPVGWEEH